MVALQTTPSLLLAAFILSIGATMTTEHQQTNTPAPSKPKAAATVGASRPGSCLVTQPPSQPFVPPSPYPSESNPEGFWFGSEKLWILLPTDGTWNHLGHYRPTDTAFRQKLFWWRQGYDWRTENPPKLMVTGKRLDSSAPPLSTDDHANAGWRSDRNHAFMVTGIDIPTLGCWQITGDYKGDKLTFVMWVAP